MIKLTSVADIINSGWTCLSKDARMIEEILSIVTHVYLDTDNAVLIDVDGKSILCDMRKCEV